jgi:hypothetical protein
MVPSFGAFACKYEPASRIKTLHPKFVLPRKWDQEVLLSRVEDFCHDFERHCKRDQVAAKGQHSDGKFK